MIGNLILVLSVSCLLPPALITQEPRDTKESPAEQYQALVDEFEQLGRAPERADNFLALAREYPEDPVAVDALTWVVVNVRDGAKPAEAIEILLDKYTESERLGAVSSQLVQNPSLAGEKLLRAMLEKSPHRKVQAQACFHLAAQLGQQRKIHETIKSQPASRRRFDQFYGKEFVRQLAALDGGKLAAEIEQLYDRVIRAYGDVDEAMTKEARSQLVELRHLAVGKPAMEIEGEDIEGIRFKLSDYRGQVVVLNFWGNW